MAAAVVADWRTRVTFASAKVYNNNDYNCYFRQSSHFGNTLTCCARRAPRRSSQAAARRALVAKLPLRLFRNTLAAANTTFVVLLAM